MSDDDDETAAGSGAGRQWSPSCTTSHNQLVTAHRMTAASAVMAITTALRARLIRSGRWGGSTILVAT